jgi:chromosome segregation ATPase
MATIAPAADVVSPTPSAVPAVTPARPDFWSRLGGALGRFFGFLLRLIFILLLAVALGAGVYFGLPWLYRALVQPVQTHTSQIQELYNRVEGVRAGVEAGQATQNDRLTALETANDAQRLQLDSTVTQGADHQATLDAQGQQLETTAALAVDLQAALDAETAAREALAAQLAEVQSQLADQASANAAMQTAVAELQPATDANTAQAAALQQQLTLVTLENALLRARLQVVAENFGEARATLTTTVSAMQAFVETPAVFSSDAQASLTVRLRAAASLIEAEPAAALTDLDSIWAEMDRLLHAD